ncbi:MAG TPA: APC family permease [Candidatus Polarisedimenticolaceae bacterium]|nr:APC family permease [Candidatus Polarisedimenticolaceae bacterium]
MSPGFAVGALKHVLVGRPIPSHLAHHERYTKSTGLAILSSDALSSVAYATEEILRTLLIAGTSALWFVTPIGAVIAGLMLVIAFSYRQTIHSYPGGGGAYRVARENIGVVPGLVAAAALLLDYVLTVAVSIAAGVAAITSAFPQWHDHTVVLSLLFLVGIAIGNLRGIRESGRIFAIPTYFFLVSMGMLLVVGAYKAMTGQIVPIEATSGLIVPREAGSLTVFLVLRAFANGCTALTGIEAISDGVPAFKPPEAKNAATTLLVMAACAVTLFMGVTLLAHAYAIVPKHDETVISQLNRAILGGRGSIYYMVQAATTMILVLAANTAYSDFPRLASIVARDKFLPRQFANQGDRLAFSNGIIVLSVLAGVLLVAFRGDTHALIPLYMLGVFVSFTLSQAGMVLKWRRERKPNWRIGAFISGLGATLTLIVLCVVAATKFMEGAWIIIVLIPVIVVHFLSTHRHYERVAEQLSLKGLSVPERKHNTVIVPIGGVHRAVVQALEYARTLSDDVRAVYVDVDPRATQEIREEWTRWGKGVRLEILASPFRSVMEPLLEYIEITNEERPNDFVTVLLPEFVPARWWHHLLHNQRALLIKGALLFRENIVVTSVPYHLHE